MVRHIPPEIIGLVVGETEEVQERAALALVARAWSRSASEALWKQLQDILPLFHALGAVKDESGEWVFPSPLTPKAWIRAAPLLARVRGLEYDADHVRTKKIASSAWDEVLRSKPPLEVFPNLRYLKWYCCEADDEISFLRSIVFMHETVRDVFFGIPSYMEDFDPWIQHTFTLMPHLTELLLYSRLSIDVMSGPITQLLEHLPSLEHLKLPNFFLTWQVINALSKISSLQSVAFLDPADRSDLTEDMMAANRPEHLPYHFHPEAFENLTHLVTTIKIQDFITFLDGAFTIKHSSLNYLFLDTIRLEDDKTMKKLYEAIAKCCSSLKQCHVFHRTLPIHAVKYEETPLTTFGVIRPMLRLKNLEAFTFNGDYILLLTESELREALINWPSLKQILISTAFPIVKLPPPPSYLTLRVFDIFAECLPEIERIGLYLNAQAMYSPSEQRRLNKLHTLWVGPSPVGDPIAVAETLSNFLTPAAGLSYYNAQLPFDRRQASHLATYVGQDVLDWFFGNEDLWDAVIVNLKFLQTTKNRWSKVPLKVERALPVKEMPDAGEHLAEDRMQVEEE